VIQLSPEALKARYSNALASAESAGQQSPGLFYPELGLPRSRCSG
jgi:hypothetical protein